MVEVAEEALEFAEALVVQCFKLDAVAAAGRAGDLGDQPLDQPIPDETRIGHVHLYVGDLDEAMRCYTDLVGFQELGRSKAFKMGFVSAGGYHHHVGMNTWMGEGAPPPPPGSPGLRHFTVELPSREGLVGVEQRLGSAGAPVERVDAGILARDPSENAVLFAAPAG